MTSELVKAHSTAIVGVPPTVAENKMSFLLVRKSSYKERRVNALALRADEGRDKLRKASGRRKWPTIRRYPNGATHHGRPMVSCGKYIAA